MGKTLVIDFETDDRYIGEGKGAGWVWGIPVLGMACLDKDTGESSFITNKEEILSTVGEADLLVCHNAQYEAGVLLMMGFDIRKVSFFDTMCAAVIHDNTLFSHGLGDLGSLYFKQSKDESDLGKAAMALGLVKSKAQNPVKIAKSNMGVVFQGFPSIVAKYAIVDVEITNKLYEKFKDELTEEQVEFYSDLIKSLVFSRKRGVRVSIERAKKAYKYLNEKEVNAQHEVEHMLGDVNINSPKQLAAFFDSQGWKYDTTDKGGPSFTKEFFEKSDLPVCKAITRMRLYQKARRDFVDPILEQANGQDFITVHPEIKIFGAKATGRASCSNPNLQQIPKRNKELSVVRDMYVPFEGEKWFSLDFSSQEPRLQVHYASLLRAPGVDQVVKMYQDNPRFDLHGVVAEMAGIDRTHAKTINLGVSYGMGLPKMAKSLGVAINRASILLEKYHTAVPYLKSLDSICKKAMKIKGFIKTLGGRPLRNEKGFEYKALNKLIQGSAADQTYACMVEAYRQGLTLLFPLHDELFLSGTVDEAKKLRYIMSNTVKLQIPSVSDLVVGDSWGEGVEYVEEATKVS